MASPNPYQRVPARLSPFSFHGSQPPLATGPNGVMYLPEEGPPPPAPLATGPDGVMYLPEEGPPPEENQDAIDAWHRAGGRAEGDMADAAYENAILDRAPPGVTLPEVPIEGTLEPGQSSEGFQNPFARSGPGMNFGMHAQGPPGPEVAPSFSEMQAEATPRIEQGAEAATPGEGAPAVNPRFAFGAMGSGPLGAPRMGGSMPSGGAETGAAAAGGGDPFGATDEYEFVDAQGNVVYSGRLKGLPNPNDVEAARLGKAFEPLGDDAAAIQEIAKRLQGLIPNEDIIKTATGIYEQSKDRENKLDVASLLEQGKDKRFGRRGGGGAPGTNGVPSAKNLESAFDNVNSIVTGVRGDFKPAASATNRRELMNILSMLESPNALDQRAAIGQKIKSISGAAASDNERNYYLGAAGFWSRMETMANDYMSSGQLSPKLINQLRSHALTMLKREEQNEREASAAAEARLETVPNIDGPTREKHRKALRAYYTGGGGDDPTSSGSGGGGNEPAAAGGADDFLKGR